MDGVFVLLLWNLFVKNKSKSNLDVGVKRAADFSAA